MDPKKCKVGMRVTLPTERPSDWNYDGDMDYLLGTTITVEKIFFWNAIAVKNTNPNSTKPLGDEWSVLICDVEEAPEEKPAPGKMKPKIKALWVAALRSGKYKQTTKRLRDARGYCCLGVLCDVHSKATKKKGNCWTKAPEGVSSFGRMQYGDDTALLPDRVQAWAGLKGDNPRIDDYGLAHFNDTKGFSFSQIADIIEKEL